MAKKWSKHTTDELRAERNQRQSALYAGKCPVEDMFEASDEVRRIDAELSARGERSW